MLNRMLHAMDCVSPSVPLEERHCLEVRIYLAGSVPKGASDRRGSDEFWSEEDERFILEGVEASQVKTLNPNASGISRADFYANFGCDLALVDSSDIVFVDGRAKRGIGVGAEMMFAAMRGIHVVAICPRETVYRRRIDDLFGEDLTEWIHPFVVGLADHVAGNVAEAVNWVNGWLHDGRPPKKPDDMSAAIEYYEGVAGPVVDVSEESSVSLSPARAGRAEARRASL
jgi:hypothetical protein